MQKIMFDSNAFDKLMGTCGGLNFAQKNEDKYEFYITPIQVEELAAIPEQKKDLRISNFLMLCSMRAKLIPTVAVFEETRMGYSYFATEEEKTILQQLSNGTTSHIKDDIMGTAAQHMGCTVITNDKTFINRLHNVGVSTMTFKEWIDTFKN